MSREVLHHTHDDMAQPLAQVSLEAELPLAGSWWLTSDCARRGLLCEKALGTASCRPKGRGQEMWLRLLPLAEPKMNWCRMARHITKLCSVSCTVPGLGLGLQSFRPARNQTLHTPVMMKHHPPQERHVVGEAVLQCCSLSRLHTIPDPLKSLHAVIARVTTCTKTPSPQNPGRRDTVSSADLHVQLHSPGCMWHGDPLQVATFASAGQGFGVRVFNASIPAADASLLRALSLWLILDTLIVPPARARAKSLDELLDQASLLPEHTKSEVLGSEPSSLEVWGGKPDQCQVAEQGLE